MPRYREIFETLKAEIRIGKFGADGCFPSERALMRRFSVARETIRHAIDELRKQNLIEARQGKMNVLTFRARERAIGTFGLIVPDAYPYAAPTSLLRVYGVSLAATESGLKWKDENVFFADPTDTVAAKRLFASMKRPDAIIAVNDYVASLLLKTLRAIGLKVPNDVLLAGVNGDILSAEAEPPITTAVQPCERIGEAAVQLMLQRIADPDLPPRVVHFEAPILERLSTGRGRKGIKREKGTNDE